MTAPRRIARLLAALAASAAGILFAVPAASAAPPWAAPQVPAGSPASRPALTFSNLGVGLLAGAGAGGTVGAQNAANVDTFLPFGALTDQRSSSTTTSPRTRGADSSASAPA